jgi:3-dehydroquinate dehydratase-2
MKKILILNGPNINLIGKREPDIYGKVSYNDLCRKLEDTGKDIGFYVEIFQSNSEGALIDKIHNSLNKVDFIIANFGAYTHTSIALRDALLAVKIPFVEVHLSNIFAREDFRKNSFFSDISLGIISGFGINSYILALYAAKELLK